MIVPYALLTLTALFGFVLAWSLNQIWHATFGKVFEWLGGFDLHIPIPAAPDVHIKPFGFLLTFNAQVVAFLGAMVANAEHAMTTLFGQTVKAFLLLAYELGSLAEAVERKFVTFAAGTLPHLIRGALGSVWAQLKRIPALVKRLDHLLGYVTRTVAGAIKRAAKWELNQLLKLTKNVRGVFGGIARNVTAIFKRLRRLERWVFGKGLNGIVHGALKKLKLGWLFAVNVERFGQWLVVQGVPEMYEFVKDALEIASETDVCKLAAYNYDVAVYVFEPMMMELVGVTDWFCHHKNETLASAMDFSPGYSEAWAPTQTPPITGPFTPERLAPDVPLPRGVVSA